MSESHADRTHEHTDVPLTDAAPATPSYEIIVERNKPAPAPPDGDISMSRDGTTHPEGHDVASTTNAGILTAIPEAESAPVGPVRLCPQVADLGMTAVESTPWIRRSRRPLLRAWTHGSSSKNLAARKGAQ
jgi:hypothetical protein